MQKRGKVERGRRTKKKEQFEYVIENGTLNATISIIALEVAKVATSVVRRYGFSEKR